AGAVLRLLGRGGEVRSDDDVVELEQGPGVRLRREDVERGRGDLAGAQRVEERALVDQLAAGGVDQANAVTHLTERLLRDRGPRLVGERQVQGKEVGSAVNLLGRLDPLCAEL